MRWTAVHRVRALIVRVPASRHKLEATQAASVYRLFQIVSRLRLQGMHDREADQAVGMSPHQVREMFVAGAQRLAIG